jgi:hypothetical protein
MNNGKGMKEYRVVVMLKGNPVAVKDVKSKTKGRAITNVLTNVYRGEVDSVKVYDLPIMDEEYMRIDE